MDSPPPSSGYVPVSLQDTLTQRDRTYRSAKTANAGPLSTSSSRPGPRPSHAHAGSFNAKERADAARREAAAMMQTLGMSSTPSGLPDLADVEATPRPDRSFNSTAAAAAQASSRSAGGVGSSSVEVAALKAQLGDKDDELALLRREISVLQREKKDLSSKVDKLEKEKREGGGNAGLDVRQLEELEKQFEAQEILLAGYQKEAERSAQELDSLRNRQRRLGDFLERTYGPNWAEDLELGDKRAGNSPVVRKKLVARASLANSPVSSASPASLSTIPPSLSRLNTDSSSSSSIFDTPTHSTSPSIAYDEPSSPSHAPNAASTSPPRISSSSSPPSAALSTLDFTAASALKAHLESLQALLRSMESRLIARDVELQQVEKRAREEREKASLRAGELEEVVRRLEEQIGEVQV